jgi:hypothetical protein
MRGHGKGLVPLVVQEMLPAIERMRRQSDVVIVLVEQNHDFARRNKDPARSHPRDWVDTRNGGKGPSTLDQFSCSWSYCAGIR